MNSWETETRIAVGDALEAGERLLYPVFKVVVRHSGENLLGLCIIPLAVLAVEQDLNYLISLPREEAASEELAEIAPSLKAIVEKAQRNSWHR